jgi:hypothetical protein
MWKCLDEDGKLPRSFFWVTGSSSLNDFSSVVDGSLTLKTNRVSPRDSPVVNKEKAKSQNNCRGTQTRTTYKETSQSNSIDQVSDSNFLAKN